MRTFRNFRLILASQSPRRQFLMKGLDVDFEVLNPDVDETFPEGMSPEEIALYLAEVKADSFDPSVLEDNALLISADTIVSVGDEILGKPSDKEEARRMLKKLSGRMHEVITAVCLRSKEKKLCFHVVSSVWFKELTDEEISYYIENYQPYDKAGSYGVQEWIGYIAISRIDGSFFNIMGLPVMELYEELEKF